MMSVEIETFVERRLGVSQKAISEFCQRWQMIEFAVFGSVLRSDFCFDSNLCTGNQPACDSNRWQRLQPARGSKPRLIAKVH